MISTYEGFFSLVAFLNMHQNRTLISRYAYYKKLFDTWIKSLITRCILYAHVEEYKSSTPELDQPEGIGDATQQLE